MRIVNNLIERLTEKLMDWCESKGRTLHITGSGEDSSIYLIRYYVVRSKYFNFFIHQFLRSDRDDLHDHPWHFCTFLVRGAYTEKKWNFESNVVETIRRQSGANERVFYRSGDRIADLLAVLRLKDGVYTKNRFVLRKATDQHRVLTDITYRESEKEYAPLTLCFTGPQIREWGFIKETEGYLITGDILKDAESFSKYIKNPGMPSKVRRWVPWRKYLDLNENEPGRG